MNNRDNESERQAGAGEHERVRGAEVRRVTVGSAEILVARHAGYCYGVERALKIAETAIGDLPTPLFSLGPIIHNPAVVRRLQERGIDAIDDLDQASSGTVIVRTHGVPPAVIAAARDRGLDVLDATCPFVTIAQRKAAALSEQSYVVLILGEADHPEVAGLKACAGEQAVVLGDAGALHDEVVINKRVGIVVQTTQTRANLSYLVARVAPLARELLVYNTICYATEQRQSAAREVALEADVVVVVGGRNSANTTRLAALCRAIQPRTYLIERAAEIDAGWLAGQRHIGVTAGASTPQDEIDATVQAILNVLAGDA
ncbi:MAG: 4-hydroxy-3-methylbut-2-enyl diphosphate reductase [Thermoleophilia bacterium]